VTLVNGSVERELRAERKGRSGGGGAVMKLCVGRGQGSLQFQKQFLVVSK
jgi:hypothetical protein